MQRERPEDILALYEKEEREFQQHWVWKELQCKPEAFFKAVREHVDKMKVSPEIWEKMYARAKEASRVRSSEKRAAYRPMNLKLIGALRV